MKIVGVYNIKGGVGKTATAVNLGYLASRQGLRTLIWDLDPQGAASFYFRIKPKVRGGGKGLLKGKRELDELVKGTDFEDLDLLPADFSYRHMDLVLEDSNKPTKQLLRLLRPLSEAYDLVLLDCPPSISLVSENIFRAADLLLVPTIPTTLSARTLDQLHKFIEANHRQYPVRLLPFFSMADRRKRMHQDLMSDLPRHYPHMLETIVPYASDVERMGSQRAPVGHFASGSKAAKAYRSLWDELQPLL
jgi:chromosome partitioning protein